MMTTLQVPANLLGDLRDIIDATRGRVAATVNRELVLMYWRIGQRIRTELLH